MLDGRAGGHRRGSPRHFYVAGSRIRGCQPVGLVQYPGCFVFDKFERSRKFYFRNCYILNIGMACSRQAAVNGISCLLCVAVVAFFAQVQSLYLWRHAFLSTTETNNLNAPTKTGRVGRQGRCCHSEVDSRIARTSCQYRGVEKERQSGKGPRDSACSIARADSAVGLASLLE